MNRIITVIGRRWFDRSANNTYHSVVVYVNGDHIATVPFEYGYDRGYEQTALKQLVEAGIYPPGGRILWQVVQDAGDKLINSVSDVARKKDL